MSSAEVIEDLHAILRRQWKTSQGKNIQKKAKWSFPWVTAISVFLEIIVYNYHNRTGLRSDFVENIETSILAFHSNKRTEVWRLVTNVLVHGSLPHLLGNVLFQLVFMTALEAVWGSKMTFLIFFTGEIAGCLLSSVVGICIMHRGASCGMFAIFAIVIISCYRARQSLLRNVIATILLLYLAGTNILAWWYNTSASISGHLGGFLTGALLYIIFEMPDQNWFGYSRRMILTAGFILLLFKAIDFNMTLQVNCVKPGEAGISNGTQIQDGEV